MTQIKKPVTQPRASKDICLANANLRKNSISYTNN